MFPCVFCYFSSIVHSYQARDAEEHKLTLADLKVWLLLWLTLLAVVVLLVLQDLGLVLLVVFAAILLAIEGNVAQRRFAHGSILLGGIFLRRQEAVKD